MSLATTPVLSRNAVVQVGGATIGFLTDFTMDVKAEMIKEYVCASGGSPSPAFTASGNQSYTFKASALYVPANYAALLTDVLNGSISYGYLGTTRHNYRLGNSKNHVKQRCLNSLQREKRAERHHCKRHQRRSTEGIAYKHIFYYFLFLSFFSFHLL